MCVTVEHMRRLSMWLDKGPICPLHLLGELGSVCGDGRSWVRMSSGGAGEVKWEEEKKCQTWFKCVHDEPNPTCRLRPSYSQHGVGHGQEGLDTHWAAPDINLFGTRG
jgi:hypothetical protein